MLGRYEFLLRRLHSLTGLVPICGFLGIHLATNASILDGAETFGRRVDQIHSLGPSQLFVLEWCFIFLPILFHGLFGLMIVSRGKRNLTAYPYSGNIRYTLQRATGVLALLFILAHVFHMHGWIRLDWWIEHVAHRFGGAQFDPHDPLSAAAAIQASPLVALGYAVGILACAYHLANGLWTMTITWGLCTSPTAQRRANIPCIAVGLLLAAIGLGALYGMQMQELPTVPEQSTDQAYPLDNPPDSSHLAPRDAAFHEILPDIKGYISRREIATLHHGAIVCRNSA